MTIKTLKLALGLAAVSALTMQSAIADWSISGKDILDPNGNPFIYRGISLGDFPSPLPTLQLQQDLAQTGANALKVLVSNVTTAANLQSYIDLCVANKMVCVFSHSDAYGWGDDPLADHYANAFNYWIRSDVKQVLNANKDYAIINIGNGPTGNILTTSNYIAQTQTNINIIRFSGVQNQLMVEAGNWGQDWQGVMRDNAQFITNLDPLENTILAVHMYEAYPAAVVVESYLQAFHDVDLPIVISEFAPKARKRTNEYQSPYPLKTVNAEAIIDVAHEKGVGYIGWSWKPNPVGYSELDLVDSITSALTPWGELLINSEKGIKATAQAATHYDDSVAENNEPVAVLDLRGGGGCDDAHAMLSAAGSTDIDGDSLSYSWRITNHLDSDVVTSTDVSWTFPLTYRIQYTVELTVDDGRGGVSSTTRPVGHFASACRHLTQSSAASWSSGRSSEAPTPPSSSSVASVSSAVSSSAAAPASASSSVVSTSPLISSSSSSTVSSISNPVISSSAASQSIVNSQPVASFTYRFELGNCTRMDAVLSALGSSDPDGDSLSFRWKITNDVDAEVITSTDASLLFPLIYRAQYTVELTVDDGRGGVSTTTDYIVYQASACSNVRHSSAASWSSASWSSMSSSVAPLSSSSSVATISSWASSSAASQMLAKATCSYVIQSEWQTGFVAVVRLKNNTKNVIDGWSLDVRYNDGSAITNLWNANLQGNGPYSMSNLNWNKTIQPGQTVEFGFQGTKPAGKAMTPSLLGASCL